MPSSTPRSAAPRAWLPLFALAALAACQDPAAARRAEVDRLAAERARYLEEFSLAQLEFARANPVPQRHDLGPQGSLLVREAELGGRPGSEQLRVKFTYVNSTGRSLDSARVFLTLGDAESGAEWSEVIELRIPFGLGFHPNSSYTTEFRMPLHGLYRRPGWSWSLSAETVYTPEPLEAP